MQVEYRRSLVCGISKSAQFPVDAIPEAALPVVKEWDDIAKLVTIAMNFSGPISEEKETEFNSTEEWKEAFPNRLNDPRDNSAGAVVAIVEGRIVGYAQCESDGDLTMAFVHPNYRRNGIGRGLVDFLAADAEEMLGDVELRIDFDLMDEFSPIAMKFMIGCGFTFSSGSLVKVGAVAE